MKVLIFASPVLFHWNGNVSGIVTVHISVCLGAEYTLSLIAI